MADIARAAGVHQTTVSLAFRNHPSIPVETRERLLAVAEKMGYRPNPLVSVLMSQLRGQRQRRKHEVIAYLSSHPPENPWRRHAAFNEMFGGARSGAASLGFVLQEFDLKAPGMSGERMKGILVARGIRAVLIAPLPDDQTTVDMDFSRLAAVALGVSLQAPAFERVSNDHYQSMRLAFQKCRERGYRRIGFMIGKSFSERLEDRWLGAYLGEQALGAGGGRLKPLLLTEVLPKEREPVIEEWCRKERPDVVISPLGAAQAEYKAHFETLPERPALVNLTRAAGASGCAGILQDAGRLGEIGIERVASRLQHNDFGPLHRIQNSLLHGEWIDDPSLPSRVAGAKGIAR